MNKIVPGLMEVPFDCVDQSVNFLNPKNLFDLRIVCMNLKNATTYYTGDLHCKDLSNLNEIMRNFSIAPIKVNISNAVDLQGVKAQLKLISNGEKREELQRQLGSLLQSDGSTVFNHNTYTLLVYKTQIKCLSVIETIAAGKTAEYTGDNHTPVEFNPATGRVLKCLSFIKNTPDGTKVEYTGDNHTPVEFNPATGIIIQCLSFIKTFTDGRTVEYTGDKHTPVEIDPATGRVPKCLSFIETRPDGTKIKLTGNKESQVEIEPATGVVTKCLSFIETRPDGARIEYMGGNESPEIDPDTGVTKYMYQFGVISSVHALHHLLVRNYV